MSWTRQTLFDTVVKHAATQGCRAQNDAGDCMYRGPHGRKCFVGALIPDERYTPEREGKGVRVQNVNHAAQLDGDFGPLSSMANDLQLIHDRTAPVHWRRDLEDYADEHDLTFNWPQE